MKLSVLSRLGRAVRARQAVTLPDMPHRFPAGMLRKPRAVALFLIACLVTVASLVSFAESYRGLYLWAHHHDLSGTWAALWPVQVDTFVAVGELALFVALVDGWPTRSRVAGWLVTLVGLAVSVAGNIGHVSGHSITVRGTAAIPPIAAASALAVGLGVLKRVVGKHHQATEPDASVSTVPADSQNAAMMALRATLAAGNPLSGRQLESRFGLTRAEATKVRDQIMSEQDHHMIQAN